MVTPSAPKKKAGMTREEIAKLESEMESIGQDVKAIESSYGENMLNLTIAKAYIKKLIDNARVVRFLTANYPDLFAEFEKLAAAEGL